MIQGGLDTRTESEKPVKEILHNHIGQLFHKQQPTILQTNFHVERQH